MHTATHTARGTASRVAVFLYGALTYALFFACLLYAIGFVTGVGVPKHLDSGTTGDTSTALLVDVALLGLFALQHSVMARRGFKRRWTAVIPASVERPTYVLATVAAFALLFWLWQPLPHLVWDVQSPALRAALWTACALGWLFMATSTFMIGHFELFGLAQVWRHLRGGQGGRPVFKTPGFYRFVRHPIQLGFLVAFWTTPAMSVGHLVFALGATGYILVALQLEERDLVAEFGDAYRVYRRRVRMLLPVRRAAA